MPNPLGPYTDLTQVVTLVSDLTEILPTQIVADRVPPVLDQNHTRSLRQLFAERVFFVPDYQRGYSWNSSNVTDLLSALDSPPPPPKSKQPDSEPRRLILPAPVCAGRPLRGAVPTPYRRVGDGCSGVAVFADGIRPDPPVPPAARTHSR